MRSKRSYRKRMRPTRSRDLNRKFLLILVPLSAVMVGGALLIATRRPTDAAVAPATKIRLEGELAHVPLDNVKTYTARFFECSLQDKTTIRFFLMGLPDGKVWLALDACEECFENRAGYRQEEDKMICNECGKSFRPEDAADSTDRCNPIRLHHEVQQGQIVIAAAELEKMKRYFPKKK